MLILGKMWAHLFSLRNTRIGSMFSLHFFSYFAGPARSPSDQANAMTIVDIDITAPDGKINSRFATR
jgi:hypothetical protein